MAFVSSEIWSRFDEKTNFGTAPYLFESVLPLKDGFSGPGQVEDSFFKLRDPVLREGVDCNVRVYIDEERRDDLVGSALAQERLESEDLPSFMKRCTGHDKFGLVLNNLEQVSERLAADFGQFARTFFDVRGIPLGGIEQAVFCGNYAGTAFGIHEGFEHAFLCHLGPGQKDFYCWSREEYTNVTGTRDPTFSNSKNFEKLMGRGQRFVLKPGDALYLPASVYHIGRQTSYSVSVALPLYTYPFSRFIARGVFPALAELTSTFDQEGMSPLLSFAHQNPLLGPVNELVNATLKSWTEQHLPSFLSYYWHRLRSNGGWELPRSIAVDLFNDGNLVDPLTIKMGDEIRLRTPCNLSFEAALGCSSNQIRVFLAAKSVIVPNQHDVVSSVLALLSCGKKVKANTDAKISALHEISRTGGLEVVKMH